MFLSDAGNEQRRTPSSGAGPVKLTPHCMEVLPTDRAVHLTHAPTGQEANLVCYVDAFGILPFLPLFSEACRTERLYLSFLIPPKYFPNEPLLSLITMAREFSRRGYFWQEMRFFQTRIGTLMIVCVDSVLLEVIIWGQLGNLCRLQWAMNPQRNCLKWRGLCIPEQGSEFG